MPYAAVPGTTPPPEPPYVSPLVEVVTHLNGGQYKSGTQVRLEGFSEGAVESLIAAGHVRLVKRPSVAAMKEDNDGS